ncbi:MAG: STAS domain-containing protein [Endomicrobium sp.]|jgi:SulP family sulfate permease|nr:STAS domain-containing protein [Endomicrobium sp.]
MFRSRLFSLIKKYPKFFTPQRIFKDMAAGFIVAFIAIPLSIALGIASGVGPTEGLVTAIVAGFFVSLLGGSDVQIGGPTAAFVIIVYNIIQQYGTSGLLTATVIAGILLIIMGILKLGNLVKYFPYPIITGFTSGIAVVLFSTQINEFLGLRLQNIPSEFILKWEIYFQNLHHTNITTLLIGLSAIYIINFLPKKLKKFPTPLFAIIILTIIATYFNLNIETVGSTFANLGKQSLFKFQMPSTSLQTIMNLIPPAITIALLAGLESLLSAVVADEKILKKHASNTELIAQGIANFASSIVGGIPATGAIVRTSANINSGAKTPISGITASLFILLISLLCMDHLKLIPSTVLAAILFGVAFRMFDFKAFKDILKAPKSDTMIFMTTFLLTVFIDLIYAIQIGMLFAAISFIKRMSDTTDIYSLEAKHLKGLNSNDIDLIKSLKGISIFEISGPFFFGTTATILEFINNNKNDKAMILLMSKVPTIDSSGYYALLKIHRKCIDTNTKLFLCQIQRQPLKMLKKYGFIEILGRKNFAITLHSAIIKAQKYTQENNIL